MRVAGLQVDLVWEDQAANHAALAPRIQDAAAQGAELIVLPEMFAADADRLARFRREAKVLASLNHPNIAGIHGLEQAEDKIQDCKTIDRNSPFSRIRRQVARIRRYVAPQREALEHLSRSGLAPFRAEDLPGFREETNRLTLTLENLDLVRERAMVAQEEFLSLLAHEQNARMLLLSIIAAVFLPLSFLTGLMGMNVAGLPGTVSPAAFWIVSMIMLTIAAGILVLLRRRGWL